MEFTPITTQEELNAVIKDRLQRERDTIAQKYGDYDDLKKQVADLTTQVGTLTTERDTSVQQNAAHEKTIAGLQAQLKSHETNSVKMRIAQEVGIPHTLAERLNGETEEDIRKDAEVIAQHFKDLQGPAPLYSGAPAQVDAKHVALTETLHNLRGE